MSPLEISQIVFNILASLAIVVVAVLVSIIAFDIIKFIKATKKTINSINKESVEIYNKINSFLEKIFSLSLISKYFSKKKK